MFVQQKKLTALNLPAKRVRRLFCSTVDVQVALPSLPAQMASAYLVALTAGKGIQIVLGLYLADSRSSVFFLPQAREVAPDKAEPLLQDGLEFAESMGFVLADADIHQLQPDQLDKYWQNLPICRKSGSALAATKQTLEAKSAAAGTTANSPPGKPKQNAPSVSLEERRKRCKESLGRFLASL